MHDIPRNALTAMVTIAVFLLSATIVTLLIKIRNPGKDITELKLRIQSWWVMIGLLFSFLIISDTAAIIFFGLISFLALKEFYSIVPIRHVDRYAIFWTYIAIPVQYYWVHMKWYGMFIIFIPVYTFLFIPMRMTLSGETKGFIRSTGIIQWASMLSIFFISHIAYLLALPVYNELAGNIGLVLYLLVATEFNDVSQYIWGKLLGRRKILPKISPNKTWEGFAGGVFNTTVYCCLAAPFLTPMDHILGIYAGVIISVSGFVGDVVISAVKRDLRIKDSGTLIPGHGGILDRIDSLIYTGPLFFHFIYYYHY